MRRRRWTNPAARFFGRIDMTGDCWEWTRQHDRGGYSRFSSDDRYLSAHRLMYAFAYGRIPDSLDIDHLCRNRGCVNPRHLEAVTTLENVRRGRTGKHWSERTHCSNGHEYTTENTRWNRDPKTGSTYRICRACGRLFNARSRQRRNAS